MCSYIVQKTPLEGSGRGPQGWFPVTAANVTFDHPAVAFLEESLNIDFINDSLGPGARVSVEISADSARALVNAIEEALASGHQHPS
jgi:hypothetical protein